MVEIIAILVIIGILVAIAAPRFINMSTEAKRKTVAAGVAQYNSREQMIWTRFQIGHDPAALSSNNAIDQAVYRAMTFELDAGSEKDWAFSANSGGAGSVRTATLTYKDEPVVIKRTPATLLSPARWHMENNYSPDFNVESGVNLAEGGGFEGLRGPFDKIPGWERSNAAVELRDSGWAGYHSPSGDHFIELDWGGEQHGYEPDALYKDIETEPGRVYLVQIDAQARWGAEESSDIQIGWGDETVSTIRPVYGEWNKYTVEVVGNGEPIQLTISEVPGQNDSVGAFIDNIEVITTDQAR